ncbi:GNAT family N-acetyltransferase [Pseudoalteromonas sp. D15MCD-2]|uniref:GNAT family N-acetyltransferase n=1 Tax=Pseudoalteromonas TaxID=53246 RepID=UPI001EFDC754|nr:GNAT family N-acetyltransferase [Pseudoalteromonas shioyasakiensis]MCG9735272.1 GNAT family N-acetyltransferase [Pseudoalteromonas shioyasakiensis]
MSEFSHRWFNQISEIDATLWQSFFDDTPFTDHAFLAALEQTGCVSEESGWQPMHLAIYQQEQVIALLPGYLKYHSYGEYVFDWAWAEAYQQHGLEYYPKWLCGVPFTPIAGQRISINHNNPTEVYAYTQHVLTATAAQLGWSGWHINFCHQQQATALTSDTVMQRHGVQFQWFNEGYNCFEDFLASLTARKRKSLKKERAKITEQQIAVEWIEGADISKQHMQQFSHFYRQTYLKRSGHNGYLNTAFFELLQQSMADKLVLMFAKYQGEVIAATLSFKDQNCLYGRYWGTNYELDSLHFELCYYQGIEYCIANKLKQFHSGAQGEHKISRGFKPVSTYSLHHIQHGDFAAAISDFITRERQHMALYKAHCESLLPFKQQ